MNTLKCLAAGLTVSTVVSGCFFTEPVRVEKDFGNSVRQMVAAQIYDPATAHEPGTLIPDGLDGDVAASSISGYEAASAQARTSRTSSQDSPIPVVGTASSQ